MIADPETDVRAQLQNIRETIEHLEAGQDLGVALANYPGMHLLHFGTGPLATAFGSHLVVREDEQPFVEPAVHTPDEVMRLRKPDLLRDGLCPQILERIEFYNEATQGKLPLNCSDNAGPWTIATQVWHYEDMLAAIHTAPEAVHYLLDLVTECMIEFTHIQITRMARWSGKCGTVPWPWHPRGFGLGDDTMVTVSPQAWEEFYLPYNNRISREFGGVTYHCCYGWDRYFPSVVKTDGFIGMDAFPEYNDLDRIEAALAGRGVWTTLLGDMPTQRPVTAGGRDRTGSSRRPWQDDLRAIRRLKGKTGMFLGVHGDDRQDAVDRAKRLLDLI
jgi:hypothetical protein